MLDVLKAHRQNCVKLKLKNLSVRNLRKLQKNCKFIQIFHKSETVRKSSGERKFVFSAADYFRMQLMEMFYFRKVG